MKVSILLARSPLEVCAPPAEVMFGSDQMNCPGVIEPAIQAIESAAFLSEKQKREILFDNAARFLRLTESEIAALTGRGR